MNENSNNSPVSNANQPNNTATNSPPQRRKKFFEFPSLESLTKVVVLISMLVGLWAATNHFTDKLAAATLLNQREQAETALRATMFNNLMDRIVNKEKADNPEKLLLLAQLLAFNFHGHFEFKPLLIDLYENSALSGKKEVLESLARKITDQQIDMLRATVLTQGDGHETPAGKEIQDLFTSDLFFTEFGGSDTLTISYECDYVDKDSFLYLSKITPELDRLSKQKEQWDKATLQNKIDDEVAKLEKKVENSQQNPASFINDGPSQCIAVLPPRGNYKLDIAISKVDFVNKIINLSVNVSGPKLRGVNLVYEFEVTPFDFPLTDNTTIDSDHRFAIVQKNMDKDSGEIWLRLIWFPKGYITEQERPMNYSEVRKALVKEKKWYNPQTW